MEKLTINWRDEIINLFPETTVRVIPDGAVICDVCHGIGLRAAVSGTEIIGCASCGGKGYKWMCVCGIVLSGQFVQKGDKCHDCKRDEFNAASKCAELHKFQKSIKIPIHEYSGKVIYNDTVLDIDEFWDRLEDCESAERPRYLWGTLCQDVLSFDIRDALKERANCNGYEDMEDQLDFHNSILDRINDLIVQWIDEQGTNAKVYVEDYSTALIIAEVVNE